MEWYAGGLARLLADRGADVHVIVATDGESGPNRSGAPDLRAARRAEQLAAARINGYATVRVLSLPDRGLAAAPNAEAALASAIGEINPDAVFTFDSRLPSLPYLHVDHQGVGGLVEEIALRSLRVPIYVWQSRRPDTAVEITGVLDTKITALRSHKTQGLANRADAHRGWARRHGAMVNVPSAELYRRVR
jgi:LmbE family N-acetylglucosaminyl deacetylase